MMDGVKEESVLADEEMLDVTIHDDFYRDSFRKVVFLIASYLIALSLIAGVSLYIYFTRPQPVVFAVDKDWRVQPSVPLNKPYLTDPEVLQWVSEIIPRAFTYDFKNFNERQPRLKPYFTAGGWTVFLNQLNIYANYNNVQNDKLFITASPARAPTIIQKGTLETDQYYWVVDMPLEVSYIGIKNKRLRTLMMRVVVVRVPTLDDLLGLGIDNVIVDSATELQQQQQLGNA